MPRAITLAARNGLGSCVGAGQSRHRGDVHKPTVKNGKALVMPTVRVHFRAILDGASLPRLTFHALRHSFVSIEHAQGEDLGTISKMLGHKNIATTLNVYSHLAPQTRRRAADTLDAVLTG